MLTSHIKNIEISTSPEKKTKSFFFNVSPGKTT